MGNRGNRSIYVDLDLWQDCMVKYGDLSPKINDFLMSLSDNHNKQSKEKSLILEELKLIEPTYIETKTKRDLLLKELSLIEEEEKKQKELDIEEQKQRIKESHNCRICNNYIEFLDDFAEPFEIKGILFDGVCKSCFSNKNPRFWIDKADEERAKIAEGDND